MIRFEEVSKVYPDGRRAVVTLDAAALDRERTHPNYQLRTRRRELFGALVREQR